MHKLKMAAAIALLTTIASTEVLAQSFGEPAAFEAQHPDRDVLNGGALTPAARAAAGLASPGQANGWVGAENSVSARGTHGRFRLHRTPSR
jgi:hypothetical protein